MNTRRPGRKPRLTLEYTHLDGTVSTMRVPVPIAWDMARAAARKSHGSVTLIGSQGVAVFDGSGNARVTWTDETEPEGDIYGPNSQAILY